MDFGKVVWGMNRRLRNRYKVVRIGEGIFKDFDMMYMDILEGFVFFIGESIVDFV